jgi:uncharacterized protein (DUF433 family)
MYALVRPCNKITNRSTITINGWSNREEERSMIRITRDSENQPSIRNLNIKVSDVLHWLGSGMNEERIMKDHPGLEREDFLAVYQSAASQVAAPWDRIRSDIREKLDSLRRPAEQINDERYFTLRPKNKPDRIM